MTPYQALKAAVRSRGGVCTPFEVRTALTAYLQQFKVVAKTPEGRVIDWNDLYSRAEWFALANRWKKKRLRQKDGTTLFAYDSIAGAEVQTRGKHVERSEQDWAAAVEEFVAQQTKEEEDNGYNAEW